MRFEFDDKRLEALYYEEKGTRRYPHEVVDAFFSVVSRIAAATDERDLRALKSLHYEKLVGDREGQRSLRLRGGWRLIVIPNDDSEGVCLRIAEIVDYH